MFDKTRVFFLWSLFCFFYSSQFAYAQEYETVCGPRQCMSCKGTGTATYKNDYRVYDNLTYKDTGGWNQSREYYYSNTYIKSERVTGTCHVCGGQGRYKHCRQVYLPATEVKRITRPSPKNQAFFKAQKDFAKIKKDLLNSFLLVEDKEGLNHVIALDKNSASYKFIEKNVDFHDGIIDSYGNYSSHKVFSKTKEGIKKASFYDKNFKLKYVIQGEHIALGYNDLYWVESGGFDVYYDYGRAQKFPRVKLYNAKTKQYLTKNTYVFGYETSADALAMVKDGYIPAFAMVRDLDGKWVKRLGVIDFDERVIVPFMNKEIHEYESKRGLVSLLNSFDVVDHYSIERGLIEPVGELKHTCPDGSQIHKVKRFIKDEFSSQPRERTVYSFTNGATKKSYPYIFTSSSCYEDNKYITVKILDGYQYMIDSDERFYKKANSGFLANHKKEPISIESFSPLQPIELRYQSSRITKNNNGTKMGHKYYQNGGTVFDSAVQLAGGIIKVEQNDQEGLLVKHEFERKMELFFPKVLELGDYVADSLIPFKSKTGKWGLMDTRLEYQGDIVLEPQYDKIRPFLKFVLAYKNGQEFLFKVESKWQNPANIQELKIGQYENKRDELRVEFFRKLPDVDFKTKNKAYGHLRAILDEKFTVNNHKVIGRVYNYAIKDKGLLVIFPDSEGNVISAQMNNRIKLASLIEEDTKKGNYTLLVEYYSGTKGLVQISKGAKIPDFMDGKPNGFMVQTYYYTEIIDDTFGFEHYYNTAVKPEPSYIFSKSDKFYGVSKDKEKDIYIYHFTPFNIRS